MEKTYYLISCEEREENNIGVIADKRGLSEHLEEILQRNFDDDTITVRNIASVGKDYEKKFVVNCKDGEGYKFKVQLEQTILFD